MFIWEVVKFKKQEDGTLKELFRYNPDYTFTKAINKFKANKKKNDGFVWKIMVTDMDTKEERVFYDSETGIARDSLEKSSVTKSKQSNWTSRITALANKIKLSEHQEPLLENLRPQVENIIREIFNRGGIKTIDLTNFLVLNAGRKSHVKRFTFSHSLKSNLEAIQNIFENFNVQDNGNQFFRVTMEIRDFNEDVPEELKDSRDIEMVLLIEYL